MKKKFNNEIMLPEERDIVVTAIFPSKRDFPRKSSLAFSTFSKLRLREKSIDASIVRSVGSSAKCMYTPMRGCARANIDRNQTLSSVNVLRTGEQMRLL